MALIDLVHYSFQSKKSKLSTLFSDTRCRIVKGQLKLNYPGIHKCLIILHEFLAVNRSDLVATPCLKLLSKLPYIGIGGKPVHLSIVTPVHLFHTKRSLLLHFLKEREKVKCSC